MVLSIFENNAWSWKAHDIGKHNVTTLIYRLVAVWQMWHWATLNQCKPYISCWQNWVYPLNTLTHWDRVPYVCVSKLTIIASDNGSSPDRRQAIVWPNAEILLIRTLGINFSEILSDIHTFSYKKILENLRNIGHFVLASVCWYLCRIPEHGGNVSACLSDIPVSGIGPQARFLANLAWPWYHKAVFLAVFTGTPGLMLTGPR